MHDEQDPSLAGHAQRNEPIRLDSIAYQQIVKVKEDRCRLFKRDAVPGQVGGCFVGIPFEISKRYCGHVPVIVASPGATSRSREQRGVARGECAESASRSSLNVIRDGRVDEEGTDDELIAQGGIYSDLWAVQSGGELLRV